MGGKTHFEIYPNTSLERLTQVILLFSINADLESDLYVFLPY